MYTRLIIKFLLIAIVYCAPFNVSREALAEEQGDFTFITIADTQTPIPDGSGNFGAFQNPEISGNRVVFRGYGYNPYREGIYLSDGGSLSAVADPNTPAPEGTGTFGLLYGPSISGENIVFHGVNQTSGTGIYRRLGLAGNLELVANSTTAMPGGGGNFNTFSSPKISGENIAIQGYNYTSRMSGIYLYSNNLWSVIANLYTPVPDGIGYFTSFESGKICGDRVVFWGYNSNPSQVGVYMSTDDSLITIANQSTPIPEGTGNFSNFSAPDISGNNVVFRGFGSSQQGIYTFIDGSLHVVANQDTPIPSGTGTFGGFSNAFPAISGGYVAFYHNGAIYTNLGGQLKRVIGNGDMLNGKTIANVQDHLDLDGDNLAFYLSFTDQTRAIYLASPRLVAPDIEVSPASYDFGTVKWGQTSTVMFTISNVGNGELTISSITLPNTLGVFSITSAPSLPKTLTTGQSATVEVTFSPNAIQSYTGALLKIESSDVNEPSVDIPLSGTGVLADTPSEQVTAVTDYVENSIGTGEMSGEGPGNSADKKVNALINMIEATGDLMEAGQTVEGCQQLADIYLKVDGVSPPPDFVTGPATAGLASAIQGLTTFYECE